jgi:hypothetical protein
MRVLETVDNVSIYLHLQTWAFTHQTKESQIGNLHKSCKPTSLKLVMESNKTRFVVQSGSTESLKGRSSSSIRSFGSSIKPEL